MKLSIIIPVYNAEQYIEHCIGSIADQYYTELEIIIVDDGSTDNSLSICREYASRNKRIVVVHQENQGLVRARKTGIEKVTGDYIGFVDADDYIDKGTYSQLMERIDGSMPDMILFGLKEVYHDHTVVKSNKYEAGLYDRDEIEKRIFPTMLSSGEFFDFGILPNLVCKLIRTDFLRRSYFSVSEIISVGEDADATFQLMVQADSIQIIDINPYNYCKHQESMMWKPLEQAAIDALGLDLEVCFKKHGVYDILKEQLNDYITFVRLLKTPESVSEINTLFSDGTNRIALYGAGGFGQALYNKYGDRITVLADLKYREYTDKGLPVVSPVELTRRQDEYDFIFISILNIGLCGRIRDDLIKSGIRKRILFWGSNE